MSGVTASQSSKHICQGSADRISNLPSDLLLSILQRLSLRDAARTSVLSKQWSCKWLSLPHITLDNVSFTAFLKGREETCDICLDYLLVVNYILFSHVGPISKLTLYIPILFPKDSAISQWIRYILAKSVENFTMVDARCPRTKLPTCLFSCVGLTHLTLFGSKLPTLPATFSGFPCLVTLNLLSCAPSADNSNMLEFLISRCPLLKVINIYAIQHFQSDLTICAPELQCLSIMWGKLSSLCLVRTSDIKRCNINVECEKWYHILGA